MLKHSLFPLTIILCLFLTGCKKDNDKSSDSVVGFWTGKVGPGTNPPNLDRAFLFRNDGTVRVYSSTDTTGAETSEDFYQVSGNTLNLKYSEFGAAIDPNMQGTINAGFTRVEGTWGFGAATSGGGLFYMDKK